MSVGARRSGADRERPEQLRGLVALATRARDRAAAELAEARARLAEAERVRDEQLALIESLNTSLAELAAGRVGPMRTTAGSLELETQRRRWLRYDLEKEVFYLGTMRSDVARARAAVTESATRWRGCMARLDRLGALGDELRGALAKREARHQDALADEASSARATAAYPA